MAAPSHPALQQALALADQYLQRRDIAGAVIAFDVVPA